MILNICPSTNLIRVEVVGYVLCCTPYPYPKRVASLPPPAAVMRSMSSSRSLRSVTGRRCSAKGSKAFRDSFGSGCSINLHVHFQYALGVYSSEPCIATLTSSQVYRHVSFGFGSARSRALSASCGDSRIPH